MNSQPVNTNLWPQRAPTHRCTVCGAFWIMYSESWSLCSKECGACCDNAANPPLEELLISDVLEWKPGARPAYPVARYSETTSTSKPPPPEDRPYIEYRIKQVDRYIITRYEETPTSHNGPAENFGENRVGKSSTVGKGEYDNADLAYEVGYALCKAEHNRLGYPIDDGRIQYPVHPNQGSSTLVSERADKEGYAAQYLMSEAALEEIESFVSRHAPLGDGHAAYDAGRVIGYLRAARKEGPVTSE